MGWVLYGSKVLSRLQGGNKKIYWCRWCCHAGASEPGDSGDQRLAERCVFRASKLPISTPRKDRNVTKTDEYECSILPICNGVRGMKGGRWRNGQGEGMVSLELECETQVKGGGEFEMHETR